ncbi:hypothetical protein AWN88_00385 [Agrobacterium tumefaciens]|nr:hypothetical protein AWN88_00385 [Agrobacterium tumefaciens]
MSNNLGNTALEFRNALRGVASSVTIITTFDGSLRHGMVATAFMSVSMEPPSLIIAVNKSASIHDQITRRGAFVVNILSRRDEEIATGFGQSKGQDRFKFGDWSDWGTDVEHCALPYLTSASAAILCSTNQIYDSHGTHSLFVGDVVDVRISDDRSALAYCHGTYGCFVSPQ